MSPQAETNWKGVAAGVAVGVMVLVGGKIIDGLMGTEWKQEIKQDIKEMRQDLRDMRKDYVLKEDYDRDKKTMIELVRRNR